MEFLDNGNGGFLFKSNNETDMLNVFEEYIKSNEIDIKTKIINAKKQSSLYSIFRHYLELKKILN